MKIFKKATSTALCGVLAASFALSFAGCGGNGGGTVQDGKTVNVLTGQGGNGVEWLYELKDKFETVYASEGYKINVLEPASDTSGVLQDMYLGVEETGVDLYFVAGINSIDAVGANGDYGVLAEDIGQTVFAQKAIGYDGKEEDVTIESKISADRMEFSVDSTGVAYGFQYNDTTSGLAINKKKFAKYGLELPKTTNELLNCIQTIYLGANGVPDAEHGGHYPFTYVGGSNGYVVTALCTWMAQYDNEAYEQYWSMETTDAEGVITQMKTDGYEVFNMPAVEEMLTMAYSVMDYRSATRGSTTQGLTQAQGQLMKETGGAVMMFNGSWMMNEVKLTWKNQVDDITFVAMPVISALGTRLMGAGTPYSLDAATCDEVLSFVVGMVDQNKEISEMIEAVKTNFNGLTLSEEVVEEIALARGYVYVRGVEALGLINKDTPVKDIAALFLRMMASDDFAQTWFNTANSAPMYSRDIDLSSVSSEFVREATRISLNKYRTGINGPRSVSGLRKQIGLRSLFTSTSHIPSTVSEQQISMFDGYGKIGKDSNGNPLTTAVYRAAAKTMQQSEYTNAKKYWSTYFVNNGLPAPEGN